MRYLLIEPFGRFNGHFSTYTMLLTEGLIAAGVEVDVLSTDGFVEDWPERLGATHFYAIRPQSTLLKFVDRHFGSSWPGWYLRTAFAAKWAFGRRTDYRALHFIDASWAVLFFLWVWYRRPRNVVVTIPGAPVSNGVVRRRPLPTLIREALDKWVLKRWLRSGLHAITHSEAVWPRLVELGIADPNRASVSLIPWGVACHQHLPTRDEARKKIGYEDFKGDIFLFFGHIRAEKGIEEFIEAVRCLPETFRALVVGPCAPDYERKLRNSTESSGRSRQFDLRLGFVQSDEIVSYYRAADVAMLNYRHFLGASGVLSHAIEYQIPVIASDCGQIGSLVREHELGLLCAPADTSSLVGAVRTFIDATEDERRRFCVRMRTYAQEHSWRTTGAAHMRAYEAVVGRHSY